ncbi:MAG: 23S rRNA pseudouridine synthase F, partial [Lachnospiraceae bacterium]|nr:23S rRNA pseudouridine synthase F [Lachnospiraceae bacterium]
MRLNQYIAACGLCSRREADRLISQGQVLVDGIPASHGMSLEGGEKVTVNGRVLSSRAEPVVVAW